MIGVEREPVPLLDVGELGITQPGLQPNPSPAQPPDRFIDDVTHEGGRRTCRVCRACAASSSAGG